VHQKASGFNLQGKDSERTNSRLPQMELSDLVFIRLPKLSTSITLKDKPLSISLIKLHPH